MNEEIIRIDNVKIFSSNNEQKVANTNNEQKVANNEQKVINNEQKAFLIMEKLPKSKSE